MAINKVQGQTKQGAFTHQQHSISLAQITSQELKFVDLQIILINTRWCTMMSF